MHVSRVNLLASLVLLLTITACGNTTSQTASAPVTTSQSASVATQPAAAATPAAVAQAGGGSATATTSARATGDSTAAGATTGGIAGARTFRIVPDQSEAHYEVTEKFLSRTLPNQAIGKTKAIDGQFQFSLNGQPSGQVTKIRADLRTLTSDESRRDGRIKTQWLESNKYPFAEFTSTGLQDAPASYTEGQEVTFKLPGNMTIHGVTKPVTFDVTAKLQNNTVTGTATTNLLMRDFGFEPPSIAGMLNVQDGVKVVLNFTATEAL